jgi:outer membrane protein
MFERLYSAWALVLTVAAASGVHAQDLKLAELEAHALRTRPGIGIADARIAEAKAHIDAARSAYSPTISVLGETWLAPGARYVDYAGYPGAKIGAVFPLGSNNSGAFNPVPRYGITFDARGNLYDFGRTSAAVDAASAQRSAAQADAQKVTRDIVRDVRTAYVHWATTQALWSISERSARAAQDRAKLTEASIEEGAKRTADRTAAASEAGFAQLDLERAAANLEIARQDLGFVAVIDIGPDARPADDVLHTGLPAPAAKPVDATLTALRAQRTAAQATARVHDHALAPVLSANAQLGVQGQETSVFPLYRVGLAVAVPLWDGGSESASRAQATALAAQLDAQATEYAALRAHQRQNAEASQAQAIRRIELTQQLVQLCTTRVAQLEEGYPLGAATLLEVVAARTQLQRAETELVLARALRAEALLGIE